MSGVLARIYSGLHSARVCVYGPINVTHKPTHTWTDTLCRLNLELPYMAAFSPRGSFCSADVERSLTSLCVDAHDISGITGLVLERW